jgi:predicted deacylase
MAARESRIWTDIDFERDGKQTGFLRLPHSVHRSAYGWLPIPLVCVKNGTGPRLLLMAGNHGDEYEGQVALCKLIRGLEADAVRGRIIILPMANFPAAAAGRRTSPIDAGNLNRSFPGDPDGSPTAMIAHYIESVLMPLSDVLVDLHSGGSSLMYLPTAMMYRGDDPAEAARNREILEAFGAPHGLLFGRESEDRMSESAARRQGLTAVLTELGGSGTVTPAILALAERGLRRVLAHFGALADRDTAPEATPTRLMEVAGADYYCHSPDDGLFEPFVELGDSVAAGQPAGAVHFPETPWREPSIATFERDGLVICKRIPGRTRRGDCLFHLASDLAVPG